MLFLCDNSMTQAGAGIFQDAFHQEHPPALDVQLARATPPFTELGAVDRCALTFRLMLAGKHFAFTLFQFHSHNLH